MRSPSDDVLTALENRVIVDMKEQACLDAQIDLTAYYKVCAPNIPKQLDAKQILGCPEDLC